MTLTFLRDPRLTPEAREEFFRLWFEVSEAGGAVGFVPPVDPGAVRSATARVAEVVGSGEQRMLGAYEGGADGRLVGTAFLRLNSDFKMRHWAMVVLVMMHPSHQGTGMGGALLTETIAFARSLGLEALRLEVRGGEGTEDFYARYGFKEVGRVPGGLRVGEGDDRDDILMWLPLA
ncbi:GNAT family N-acetyltransferase [Streptomyces albireticuli]|uniref:GNAT family N-acetyltransferase n=1 Tax=Streptomyces albireticuli TaxID=1940 RepID=A0A2A2DDN6_9ACTN|nr:GNAT family N-acetyltransferase [Streptomyces albireticuli]MCD9144963.1 GNAT family N-acetyltransferase [Streptomyces albireticuli]MCD9164389.1 GNAT family N-acetyltransferase [Streptomyces albireticuli]MCD9194100.1 GNAT family N-acetyltransferase [Streptomyces albireticuli]PAU49392.1 GNAT family N-acetyltransferase [Streptomyces albireticuli]